jgi:hypothetical protein
MLPADCSPVSLRFTTPTVHARSRNCGPAPPHLDPDVVRVRECAWLLDADLDGRDAGEREARIIKLAEAW